MTETFKSAFDLTGGSLADFKTIREDLFEIRSAVKGRLDQGLPPSEVEAARGLLSACETAETLAGDLFAPAPE